MLPGWQQCSHSTACLHKLPKVHLALVEPGCRIFEVGLVGGQCCVLEGSQREVHVCCRWPARSTLRIPLCAWKTGHPDRKLACVPAGGVGKHFSATRFPPPNWVMRGGRKGAMGGWSDSWASVPGETALRQRGLRKHPLAPAAQRLWRVSCAVLNDAGSTTVKVNPRGAGDRLLRLTLDINASASLYCRSDL